MTVIISCGTDPERRQHTSAIHMLALHNDLPEDSVQQVYENELRVLAEHARIRDFLAVIVIKRIREKIVDLKNKKSNLLKNK